MASEYMKWQCRDVKPAPPPPPLTPKEKAANWFYYNKLWIAAGVTAVLIVGGILWNALGIGKIKPDYLVAYVAEYPLPDSTVEALEKGLAAFGEDVNGDGSVTVEIRSYITGSPDDLQSAEYGAAASVTLAADITSGESYFFLTDDPRRLQLAYQVLAGPDGHLPEDGDYDVSDKAYLWSSCPVLSEMELGEYTSEIFGQRRTGENSSLVEGLYLGRRGFVDEKDDANRQACERLWKKLTEGAVLP